MDGNNHRSKRRRLDRSPSRENGYIQSPVESSSDELAAGSDHDEAERRRASWSLQKALPPKRPNTRLRSFSGSESPDELAVDADVYWRSRNRGRSSSPSDVSAAGPSSEHYQDEEEVDADLDDNESPGEGDAEPEQAYSDRSPTPVPPPPPPPPPKPDKINYRQKFLLRGHLRGVSTVRFSPDSSMIASGGGFLQLYCMFSESVADRF